MSQLGSMFLAGINQGSDVAARAEGLRLANLEMQRREEEDRLRAEAQRRQLLEEDAGREFWGGQLRTLMAPDPTAQPEGPMGPQTGIPQQPPSPFTRLLGNPHVPAADLRYAYQHAQKLQQDQMELAREREVWDRFRHAVGVIKNDLKKQGLNREAEVFEAQSLAEGKLTDGFNLLYGSIPEPATLAKMRSEKPDEQAAGVSEWMRRQGGKAPPSYLVGPMRSTGPDISGSDLEAAQGGDWQARARLLSQKVSPSVWKPQGRVADPAETKMRETMLAELSKTPAWQSADPATQLILAHRVRSGFSVSPRDLAMDGVDARYVHAGAEAAAQVEYRAAAADRDDARKLFNEAFKAEKKAGKGDKAAAQQLLQQAQARLLSANTAFQEAQARLTALQTERAQVVQKAPAGPQAPAAPIDPGIIDQIMDQMPNATDEEITEEIRRRSQP